MLIETLTRTGPDFARVVELEQRIWKIRQTKMNLGILTTGEAYDLMELELDVDEIVPNLSFGELMLHRILLNKLYPPPKPREPFSLAT